MLANNEKICINLLLGLTGSVASIKYLDMIDLFCSNTDPEFKIKIVMTQKAKYFIDKKYIDKGFISLEKFPNIEIPIFLDESEWYNWKEKGDPVLHIDLRKWADIFLIAPLSANTMGKIKNGICDNLLTSIVRAWNLNPISNETIEVLNEKYLELEKTIILAPAMNTYMFKNPITEKQIIKLKKLNFIVLNVTKKKLACGEEGIGAMEEVGNIFKIVLDIIKKIKNA